MGKKIPLLISTLAVGMAGMTFSPSVEALYIDDDDVTWYTVSELLEYKGEVEQEISDLCGEDFGCRQEYNFNKMETDSKYHALEQLQERQFVMTAVNPSEEYIEVLFFGEDMMLSRMGIKEELEINQLYIGWLENDVERIYRDGMDPSKYLRGEIDGAHNLSYWHVGDTENKITYNAINRLNATGIRDNNSGQFIYNLDTLENKFSAYGRFDYSGCMAESDYELGKECRLMISSEKGSAYVPPREIVMNSEVNTLDNNNNNHSNSDNDNDSDDGNGNRNDNNDNGNNKDEGKNKTVTNSNQIKSPETGVGSYQEAAEFPWWLGVIFASGLATLIWLFWPNRKSRQKTRKKP